MENREVLQIEKIDNLIVALKTIPQHRTLTVGGRDVEMLQDVPAKQKFALTDLEPGMKAIMYGVIVGEAAVSIKAGELITTANLRHATSELHGTKQGYHWQPPQPYDSEAREFMGIRRPDGRVGTANFWIVVPLVFCSNQEVSVLKDVIPKALGYSRTSRYAHYTQGVVEQIRATGAVNEPVVGLDSFTGETKRLFANVDGISFLSHSLGCGNTPGDIDDLIALLANYITHPNVAGATVLSLGCQKAELEELKAAVRQRDPDGCRKVLYYDRQGWAGPGDMLEAVIRETLAGMKDADRVQRVPVPISELVVGVECGGSDGFSGISANPVIGRTVDHIVGQGGSAILSEFPELCGVENELVTRCVTEEIGARFLNLATSYRKQVQAVGFDFDLNPSPGNIRDGLITDAMKSAGAAKKGGTAPIVAVHDYGERITAKGLNLLCTPGSDVESVTALVGAGATLIMFSTGLGTPTGNPIVPVIKVATNSSVATRLESMIDFDSGPVVEGAQTIDQMAEKLLTLCMETASGTYTTKASRLGQEDFIPWKRGVSL